MKERLKLLYSLSSEITQEPLNSFRHIILNLISNPPYGQHMSDKVNFGTYFYHSEQWFIYHLMMPYPKTYADKFHRKGANKQYGNLCLTMLSILKYVQNLKKIHGIILHLSSTHDICDVCTPTLSVFLEKLNAAKPQIIALLKEMAPILIQQSEQVPNLEISDHLRFFMITTAFRPDITQAKLRQYYNPEYDQKKEYRRKFYGKDHITNQETTIIVNPEIPYLYVQVPVDEKGAVIQSLDK